MLAPYMLLGIVALKMFLFKKCIKPTDSAKKEQEAKERQAIQANIDSTTAELIELESDLTAREQAYNSDIEAIESKKHEIANRKEYVAQVRTEFQQYLGAGSFLVVDFQTLCDKLTSAQKDLDASTAELHVLEVEFAFQYEEWPALALDKKNVIELLKTKLINLQDELACL